MLNIKFLEVDSESKYIVSANVDRWVKCRQIGVVEISIGFDQVPTNPIFDDRLAINHRRAVVLLKFESTRHPIKSITLISDIAKSNFEGVCLKSFADDMLETRCASLHLYCDFTQLSKDVRDFLDSVDSRFKTYDSTTEDRIFLAELVNSVVPNGQLSSGDIKGHSPVRVVNEITSVGRVLDLTVRLTLK